MKIWKLLKILAFLTGIVVSSFLVYSMVALSFFLDKYCILEPNGFTRIIEIILGGISVVVLSKLVWDEL